MVTRHARIELLEAKGQDVRWRLYPPSQRPHYLRLVAANGRILATSEVYANRSNAKRAARDWLDAMADVIGVDLAVCEIRPVVVYGADGRVLR